MFSIVFWLHARALNVNLKRLKSLHQHVVFSVHVCYICTLYMYIIYVRIYMYVFSISQCDDDMLLATRNDANVDRIGMQTYQPNKQWTVVSTWVETSSRMCASNLKYFIQLRRKPHFFLFNVVLPILVLSAMTLTVFWMPCDASEKIGLAVTTVLSFTVFQLVVSEILPETSGTTPLLSELGKQALDRRAFTANAHACV